MNIAVIQDEEVENEYQIHMCCDICARDHHELNAKQYTWLKAFTDAKKPVPVPSSVSNLDEFIAFIQKQAA
jgi:hypothetical protein